MWGRVSLRIKITLLVVSIVAIASAAFSRFAYSNINELLSSSTGLGAETAAEVLAESIDPAWLRSVDLRRDLSTAEYNKFVRRMGVPIQKGTISVLSVVRVDPQAQNVTYIANLPAESSPEYLPPGAVEPMELSVLYGQTKSGHAAMSLTRPGFFMVGWSPIVDQGSTVGLVILAVDASAVKANLDTISMAIMGTMVVLVVLSGAFSFKFGTSFEKAAVTDGLMGIYNHRYLKQRLEGEVAKARRYGQQTTLVLLDIDFFKRVNDSFGHATGDLVLKSLAKWVQESTRVTDIVARYGGEEIAVILPHTSLAGAQEFAERLRLKIAHQVVRDPEEDAEFRVTVSVGVAQWESGMEMLDLIKRADAALYHSKHMGRNRVTIYQDEILPAAALESVASRS